MTARLTLMVLHLPLLAAALQMELHPQVYNITWNPQNFSRRIVLHVYNGDTLMFICPDGVFSRVEEQTQIQVDSCNKSVDSNSTVERENVGNCLGSQKVFFVELQNPSDRLPGVSAYPPGFSYYFTSYTPVNASLSTVFDTSITSGGLCLRGMQIQVNVLYNPTQAPTSVDNGDQDTTNLGGPGNSTGFLVTTTVPVTAQLEPPSLPRNVRVVSSTSTSVTLTWDEPLSTGGRSRDELRYSIWYRAAGDSDRILYGIVNTTTGVIRGLVSGVVYQLFVSAETDITSQIPDSDLENRSVAISYQSPNPDSTTASPNTDSVIVSTEVILVSVTSVAMVAVVIITCTVALSIGVLCYKKKSRSMELDTEGANAYALRVDEGCEQAEVSKETQKLEEVRADLVPSIRETELGVAAQPNITHEPQAGSEITSPSRNSSDRQAHAAQQQSDNTDRRST